MKLLEFRNFSFVVTSIAVLGLFSFPQMVSSKTANAASEPVVVPFGNVVLNSFNGKLYATEVIEGPEMMVRVIDPATNTVVDSIPLGTAAGGLPTGIAFNPDNGNLYVPSLVELTRVVNATTNTVETSIDTGTGSTQGPFVFDSVNGKFYIASTYDESLRIIDTATNEPVGSPIKFYGVPGKLAFSPVTGDVYLTISADVDCGAGCAPSDNRRVLVIDGTSNTVKAKVLVGTSPTGIVASSDGNLYVLNAQNSTVSVINGATNTVIGDPIPVGINATTEFNPYDVPSNPSPIAFDPVNGKVYVIMNDNTLTIIDSASNEPVGDPISLPGSTEPALGTPFVMGINPVNGDAYVLSSHGIFKDTGGPVPGFVGDITLTVIDSSTNEIKGSVLGLDSNVPIAIGVHPDTGVLYSLNLVNGTLSVTDPLRPPLPTSVVSFTSHFHEGGPFPGFGDTVTDDVISGCDYGLYGQANKQGNSVGGFWSNLGHRGFQTGDFGSFNQLTTDGETFEIRGMRTGEGDGTMQVICEGQPVSNSDSPVVVTGDCGPDSEITFTVGDNIKEVFIGDSTCAVPVTSPSGANLTVNTLDLSGAAFTGGLWTVIRSSNGTIVETGFTPLEFQGTARETYKVTVSDFDDKTFDHWQDNGSTERTRTLNLTSDTTLTAVYDIGDALRGFTPLTYTGAEEQPDLTVNAAMLEGEPLHMWTIIDPQDTNSSGTTYKVYAGDYQDKVFAYWDDGSTDRVRTLTITEDRTIIAFYQLPPPVILQSVSFEQKTYLEIPNADFSERGIDAQFTCPDGSSGGTKNLFRFGGTNTDAGVTGEWWTVFVRTAGGGDKGPLTDVDVNSTNFKVEGTWDPVDPGQDTGVVCSAPIPSPVTIEGPCGNDVIVRFSAANGVTGTFRGNVTCSA